MSSLPMVCVLPGGGGQELRVGLLSAELVFLRTWTNGLGPASR